VKPWIGELEAYAMAIIGVVADQLVTRLVISKPNIYEFNPHTVYLMERGLWGYFDGALLIASIGVSTVIMRKWSFPNRWVILLYFVACFVIRSGAAMNNLLYWLLW